MTTITEQLGRVLSGRYRLDVGLGTGSSAHVYAAFDTRLDRQVAVKLLHPGLARDERFVRRLQTEARAVAALNHPNVLEVYDWGEEEDGPFLVLEYLGGGSLQDIFDAGARLDVPQVVAIGVQAARGLAYAHRRGFVHRDVKPANLLFDEDGVLRIADFGLARALAEAAWTEPSGAATGTARYASPELAEGRPLDDRSDVYALALVLYEAVVGRVPFTADTTLATLLARLGAVLPMTPELGPLAPILAQAAISEPLARLSAEELANDLELLARQLPAPGPLPLAGPAAASAPRAPRRAEPAGASAVERVQPAGPAPVRPSVFDGEAHDGPELGFARGDRDREADTLADDRGVLAPTTGDSSRDEPGGTSRSRRRRADRGGRKGAVVSGALVLVVLVLLGAAAFTRFVVFGHTVPRLVGVDVQRAGAQVAAAGLRLDVAGRQYAAAPAGTVLRSSLRAGSLERAGTVVRVTVSLGHAPVEVPAVVGKSKVAAISLLRVAHFVPRPSAVYDETVPAGVVVSASPAAGSAAFGSAVRLMVSKGPAPRTIPTDLGGASWATARADLVALRLVPSEVEEYSDTVPQGDVLATQPAGGTTGVVVGSTVRVVVSLGPRTVQVPSVKDLSIDAAIALLQGAGLPVTEQVGPPGSTYATTTDPLPGAAVRPGTDVTLYVG
jgi:serine/threonine-protein kinase